MRKQVDVTRVPNMEGRREAERLYTAYLELDKVAGDLETAARKEAEGDTGATQAREKADAAYEAYEHSACPALDIDDDGEIKRCALSGLSVLEDDVVMVDDNTGELVLKHLLGDVDVDTGAFVDPAPAVKAAA